MVKKLFPAGHLIGFVGSLLLTLIALVVIKFDVSYGMGLTILIVTAILQASVQLFLFMHIGESADKKSLYVNILYAAFIAIVVVIGSIFAMVWGYQIK